MVGFGVRREMVVGVVAAFALGAMTLHAQAKRPPLPQKPAPGKAAAAAPVKMPEVVVGGIQVVNAPFGDDDWSARPFNSRNGTKVVLVIKMPEGMGLIEIDEDKSSLDTFTDEKVTQYAAEFESFPDVAKDGSAGAIEAQSEIVAGAGMTSLRLEGTLALKVATGSKPIRVTGVALTMRASRRATRPAYTASAAIASGTRTIATNAPVGASWMIVRMPVFPRGGRSRLIGGAGRLHALLERLARPGRRPRVGRGAGRRAAAALYSATGCYPTCRLRATDGVAPSVPPRARGPCAGGGGPVWTRQPSGPDDALRRHRRRGCERPARQSSTFRKAGPRCIAMWSVLSLWISYCGSASLAWCV